MRQVGVTGAMGSGKSTVCKIFVVLGIPVYYADDRAKSLMNRHEPLRRAIQSKFGDQSYDVSGKLDTQYMAHKVFDDTEALEQLNALVHPHVFADYKQWSEQQGPTPYIVKEAALLYESGSFKTLDQMIVVDAPLELCISRIMARDDIPREAILARMKRQDDPASKVARADHVIHNDNETPLIPQVLALHERFIKNA